MESARFVDGFGPAEGLHCTRCRQDPPMFERAVAYGAYEGSMREMVHLLKYEQMRPLAGSLGRLLADSMLELKDSTARELLVTPVPLFRSKERARGFNQTDLLAREAIKAIAKREPAWRLSYAPSLMTRGRATKSQFEVSRIGRVRNVKGAFHVRKEMLPE